MKHWLVLYDISDAKRLRRVAKIVEKFGRRVQYSGFEITGDDSIIEQMRKELEKVIDDEEDSVVYIGLCKKDWIKRERFSENKKGKRTEGPQKTKEKYAGDGSEDFYIL